MRAPAKKKVFPVAACAKLPILPSPDTVPNSLDVDFEDELEVSGFVLRDFDLSGREAKFSVVRNALFQTVNITSTRLERPRLTDVRFERCDLSNSNWIAARMIRLELIDSKLTGFRSVEAEASDCRFQGCVGGLVQFRAATFKSTIFSNCKFAECDFSQSNLEGAVFENCDLQNAIFYDAKLEGADFRSSLLTDIKARPQDLKGAIISSEQCVELARTFASLLGITVKDGSV